MPTEHKPDLDAEAPFRVEDLFFSRTDPRGVILAGNDVFREVSEYDWPELVGAPHKLIRHADMPKAVFHLLWQTIQAGRPIGAYVKNRAKSGRYYWVFAVVSPDADGFLSVRFKPTSPLLQDVAGLYAEIRRQEVEERLDPAASAARLLERLREVGYETYEAFMAHALAAEVQARDAAIGSGEDGALATYAAMSAATYKAKGEAERVKAALEQVRSIPFNLRIQASRMGALAGPIGVIASNHGALSEQILTGVNAVVRTLDEVAGRVIEGQFIAASARLQSDMVERFRAELESGIEAPLDLSCEMAHLTAQRGFGARARVELEAILARVQGFEAACLDMRRVVAGLNITRMMCKVESGRLSDRNGGLDGIIAQLGSFQETLAAYLEAATGFGAEIRGDVEARLAELQPANAA
jgi:aerotaxis receptor